MNDDDLPPAREPAARPPAPHQREPHLRAPQQHQLVAVPRRRSGLAVLGRFALVGGLVAAMGVGMWGVAEVTGSRAEQRPTAPAIAPIPVTPADVEPGAAAPSTLPVPQAAAGQDPLVAWVERVTTTVDIPARALLAYVHTDLALQAEQPACRLSWATLAAIGLVESDHGRFGGAVLGDDGRPSKPIIGLPLDGADGVREIRDTDAGRLDGDTTYDRAVGPMQFIPSTWAKWGADGNDDGRLDPQNIDDAVLSAGRYLCSDSRDTASGEGWWAAVLSYNRSVDYGQRVFGVADRYARSVAG